MDYLALVVILGLAWLGKETNWLTIRLLVGAEHTEQRKSWNELGAGSITTRKTDPGWLRWPGNQAPLCGWDWLKNTMHIIPESRIALELNGVRYKMTIKKCDVIKDIMRANKIRKRKLAKAY